MKSKFTFNKLMAIANLIFLVLLSTIVYSQSPTYYNANGSTGSNTFPLGGATNKVQWIYGPNLFKSSGSTGTPSGSGTITKIYFRLGSSANATTTYTDYTVSLSQNVGTATNFTSSTFITGLTTCFYSASFQMTGATINSWYGINLSTPFSYDASKSLIFELKSSGTGSGNYVAQAGGGGRIWGVYAGTTGSGFDANIVDFGIDLAKGSNDAGITSITPPLCKPALQATYTNFGINAIDSVKINWSVNSTIQTQNRYSSVLATGQSIKLTLAPDYSGFIDGNTYTVKVWTSLPNNKQDTLNKNDTSTLTFKYLGPAKEPTVSDIIKCGPGQVPLNAVPGNAGDSIIWYDAATGGNIIAKGKNTLSPSLVLGVNTYYVQAFKIGSPSSFANSMVPSIGTGVPTGYSGGFADITPNKGILIDSFAVSMSANIQNATWNVWMRTGTYVGYSTSSVGWTKIGNNVVAKVRLVGSYYRSYIKIPEISLASGTTYGFYITSTPTTPCTPWCLATPLVLNISNADMAVFQDRICYGTTEFSTQVLNRVMTWETFYRPANCPSNRVPIKVTVKPSPNGAAFIKSTPFETTRPNTTGSTASPDIVAKGDKLTYEITPPTGYNNADYGSTWIMSGFTLRTKSGFVVPSSYYSPASPTPFGGANAKVTFSPGAALVDSTFIMTVSIKDLGPHYCDSLLTRNIFVAPRPVADFKFGAPICDGDNVIFTNTSTLSSGYIINKWDFGTGNPGDTSVFSDAVFVFPTHGTYMVKLITTSVPYGYTDNVTFPVVVTEIPKIGFKVYNACLGDSLSFINSTTIGSGTIVYKWDFGNGGSSSKVNPKYKYPVAGGYKVTLKATSNGCSQSLTKSAQQFARPVAKFTLPPVLCDKTDIAFTNGSSIPIGNMGYSWNFGDGAFSGFTNPLHSFSTPGSKSVKLRVLSEFGCADSITQTFTLAEAPQASFTTGTACNLSPTSFIFNGSKPSGYLTNFLWDFAGEGTTTVENPTKIFNVIGKKLIKLTLISNNGCSDVLTKEIDVKLQSKADFDVSDVCEGEEVVFTNKSTVTAGNLLFNWKFGDALTSNAQSPRHLYAPGISKTYNVTLVAIVPGGCSDSINKPVTVNANPESNFTFSTSGRLVTFNASQTGNTNYHWTFGDGGTSITPSTQYHYVNSFETAKFMACLTVTNVAGCVSKTCKEVSISSGINELSKSNGIQIYPNPNKGNFTVIIENPKSDIAISIYNLLGELVKSIETNALKSIYPVEMNLANGIYLVKVTNGGLTSTQKITINK